MKTKRIFITYLVSTALVFGILLILFWWSGASVLPIGERSFVGNARMIKPWVVFDEKPKTLLITNSRGLYGYDLSNFTNVNSYNFSLTGVGTYEIERLVKHSFFSHDDKPYFYIGLDNICGVEKNNLDGSFYDDVYLLNYPKLSYNLKRIKSLVSSPADIIRRKVINKPGIDQMGFQASFPDINYVEGGVYESLRVREQMDYRKFNLEPNCDSSAFKNLLSFLYQNKVAFKLFINPKHIRTYLAYSAKGELLNYFNMLHQYVRVNKLIAETYSVNPSAIKFYALINKYTTESFPLNNSIHDPMKYWYESSHFKSSLGKIVLEDLLSESISREINNENIDATIKDLNLDIESFKNKNRELYERVSQIVINANFAQ